MKQEEILKIWNQKKEMEDLMEWVDSLEPAYSKEEYDKAKHFFISNSNKIICENAFYSNNTLGS